MRGVTALASLLAGCTPQPVDTSRDSRPVDTGSPPTETADTSEALVLLAAITSPGNGTAIEEGALVTLGGQALWSDGTPAAASWTWASSVLGTLATTQDATWTATGLGPHDLTLVVEASGQVAVAEVGVEVVAPGAPYTLYGSETGLPSGATWHGIDVDGAGRVLGATSEGLVVLDGAAAVVWGLLDGLATDDIQAVLDDGYGQVWLGYHGLEAMDGQRITLDAAGFPTVVEGIDYAVSMEISEIHRFAVQPYGTGIGDMWMGANEGLCLYDRDLDVYAEHLHPTHPHLLTRGVTFTSDGNVWNADQYQLSRWRYDDDGTISNSADLVAYSNLWGLPVETPIDLMDVDADGMNVYAASALYGVAAVDATDPVTLGVVSFVGAGILSSASAVRVDPEGIVWIGTPTGMYRHDPSTGSLEPWGADWLPGPVHAIAIDDSTLPAGIWAATDAGLVRFTGEP
jgi:hypothetical protein